MNYSKEHFVGRSLRNVLSGRRPWSNVFDGQVLKTYQTKKTLCTTGRDLPLSWVQRGAVTLMVSTVVGDPYYSPVHDNFTPKGRSEKVRLVLSSSRRFLKLEQRVNNRKFHNPKIHWLIHSKDRWIIRISVFSFVFELVLCISYRTFPRDDS